MKYLSKKQRAYRFNCLLKLASKKPHLELLSDHNLFIIAEFLFNVVTNTLNLNKKQLFRARKILLPHKKCITKICNRGNNSNGILKHSLHSNPQFGGAILSLLSSFAPLLISLISGLTQ